MNKLEEGLNKRFGRLMVKEIIREKGKNAKYKCVCDCGKEITTWYNNLYIGKTLSCGCLNNEQRHRTDNKAHKKKHGLSGSRMAIIRNGMLSRCYNEKSTSYNAYGKRGIQVCEEWKNKQTGMEAFYKWAINNGYEDGYSIERIDVNGNYCPENCTWIPLKDQQLNKRPYDYEEQQKYALINNELKKELKKIGLSPMTIRQRMKKYQITLEEAIFWKPFSGYSLEKKNEYLPIYKDKEKIIVERERVIKLLREKNE